MKTARRIFALAAAVGFLLLPPMYFMESRFAVENPPAITHPEFYYGFLGVGLAFQVMFALIAVDPVKYRLMMIPAMIEKFSYAAAILLLHHGGRVGQPTYSFAFMDLSFGFLFLWAYVLTA